MLEQGKALLSILLKRGFEAYFIGGKCRNELNNQNHETKIPVKDIDIVTNAGLEELKDLFPNSKIKGDNFPVLSVIFGGVELEVATYRTKLYNTNSKKKDEKASITKVTSLDEDREHRDFTINAIAQTVDGTYLDYVYSYRNKKISSTNDIKNKIIRAIGAPKQRFEEDPLRMLRAFRFMSQLGYEIESGTFKAIESNLKLLESIPHERLSLEVNKIITGNFAYVTLSLMKQIGVFDIKFKNISTGESIYLLPNIKELPEDHLQTLTLLNMRRDPVLTYVETWAYLLKPLGSKLAKVNLENLNLLSGDDIEKTQWLIEHYNLVNESDLRNAIYNARTGIVKRHKLICMKGLLISLCRIHRKIDSVKYKTIEKTILDNFCARPYFEEQLPINGERLVELTKLDPGPWITQVKERLIQNLINEANYPRTQEEYDKIVQITISEVLAI